MAKAIIEKPKASLPPALPSEAETLLQQYAGAGTSAAAEHNTIPMVYVLQSNSPAVNKRDESNYITGAEPGDLWLRNAASPIVKGTEGVLFQPCYLAWMFVEWKPERQGFVAAHPTRPADCRQQPVDPNDEDSRWQWERPNGNYVEDTCYVYGLINMEHPYVIPLSSTGYRVARDWNTDMRNRKHNGQPLPVFGTIYRLKTAFRSNAKGNWFLLTFEFVPELPTAEQIQRGLELFKAVGSGQQKAEAEEAQAGPNKPADVF